MHLHRYLIALGSNLGDRRLFLTQATAAVAARIGQVTARASDYATAPLGAADQTFINSALVAASELTPPHVLGQLLHIEQELGRVRGERWGNRVIDLDVLLWQRFDTSKQAWVSGTWQEPALQIPHPHMLLRDFAMVPAAQIAGDWLHPQVLERLQDICIRSGYQLDALADSGPL